LGRAKVCGCSAADEERFDWSRYAECGKFRGEGVEIVIDELVLSGCHCEITVAAVVCTERDMDVGSPRFEPRW
jgi:hypothetical protein